MPDLPKQLNNETGTEYALFIEYLSPDDGPNPMRSIGRSRDIRETARRNQWISRALDWDIVQLRMHRITIRSA